ncbi:MAG: shikimate dehydrogenase [Rothia sp. (in: high G+C Gram-positive bacteria)]|uniref:shikimate dehydrogenase family protein n=1 Tax=Rothia sp. (in: high G+C Gram-positive bacteria) TaxID=1885016 RepID=UPI0026DF9452|nr:shikimate dehydrogenase [Rothia sp. (in: high G+C Gram-positive bacteria)]MDO5750897.1 shikimate dehydrogenase [Rothia sp. (in: high G+C Gram-positive bacteria)]
MSSRAWVLGHPIDHSLSPSLHSAAYAVLDADIVYDRRDTLPEDLPALFELIERDGDCAGLSVTMPLKTAVIDFCTDISDVARVTGAVNTVYWRDGLPYGHNTDVYGITAALTHAGLKIQEGDRAAIVGGGATAISALTALSQLGYRRVDIFARSVHKLDPLLQVADQLGVQAYPRDLNEFPVGAFAYPCIISTLPAHAADEWAPQIQALHPAAILLDVAYNPWPSVLAERIQALGGTVVSGKEMLLYQGVEQVRLFTGIQSRPGDSAPLPNERQVINAMCAALDLPAR